VSSRVCPGPRDVARHQVHRKVVLLQLQELIRATPAQERADSRQQLGERKGLDEVVVGAAVESMHAIGNGVLGRQDEDGRLEPAPAEGGEDLEPVTPRQHEIEDHDVE